MASCGGIAIRGLPVTFPSKLSDLPNGLLAQPRQRIKRAGMTFWSRRRNGWRNALHGSPPTKVHDAWFYADFTENFRRACEDTIQNSDQPVEVFGRLQPPL